LGAISPVGWDFREINSIIPFLCVPTAPSPTVPQSAVTLFGPLLPFASGDGSADYITGNAVCQKVPSAGRDSTQQQT
jgi:hypothetical protein